MKLFKLLLLMLIIWCKMSVAQQPWFTQFNEHLIVLNPAFTGNAYHLNIRAQYKTLWSSLENAPATAIVSGHSPIGISNSSVGVIIMNDEIGIAKTTGATLNYAYRFQSKIGKIVAGADIALENYREQLTATSPAMPNDPLLASDFNTMLFNAGIGVAWEGEKGYAGIAVPGLLKPTRTSNANDTVAIDPLQLNITGAYRFTLSSRWEMAPAVNFSYIDYLPSQLSILFLFEWDNTVGLIAGLKTNNAYSAGIQYRFMENFLIGYSYDYFASGIGNNGGGHEVLLGFDLNKPEGE